MNKSSQKKTEMGIVTVWLRRVSHRRLPRLKRIKRAVDSGARLNNYQITFLGKVFKDMQDALPYFDTHPEMQEMAARMVSLYHDITEQAMKNEEELLNRKAPRINFPD
jgi:hypothetical protein